MALPAADGAAAVRTSSGRVFGGSVILSAVAVMDIVDSIRFGSGCTSVEAGVMFSGLGKKNRNSISVKARRVRSAAVAHFLFRMVSGINRPVTERTVIQPALVLFWMISARRIWWQRVMILRG